MAQPRRTQYWRSIKLACWLLLPVISFGVWLTTGWMMSWVIGYSYSSNSQLQTDLYPKTHIAQTLAVTAIHARVDRDNNIAEVTLTTRNSTLERLEFKFPFTETTALETTLAKELNITSDTIQTLILYRIE